MELESGDLALKTVETFDRDRVLSEVLNNLNPSEGNQWVLSDFSIDGALNAGIFALCKQIGLRSSQSDFLQTAVTVISYSALAEFAQNIVGIGSGIAKIDFNGEQKK